MIKNLIKYFGILLVGSLIGLTVSFSIPSKNLAVNVEKTLTTFEQEGTYPLAGVYPRQIVLDNFTDSIMVNTAYSVTDNSLRSVLLADRQILSNGEVDQIKNLRAAVAGTAPIRSSYERYWHGYLMWLRPLLAVTPYQGIRIMLHIALFGLFGLVLIKTIKYRGLARGLALLAGVMAVDFGWIGQSLQFSSVFLIGLTMGLFLLHHDQKADLVFFTAGMLTALFDLLTAPLVGFGILVLIDKGTAGKRLIKHSALWGGGYGLFWAAKWLLTELVLGNGAVTNALGHVLNRTVVQPDPNFSQLKAIQLNLAQLIGYAKPSQLIAGLVVILMIGSGLIWRKKQINWQKVSYWLTVAIIPYGWYLIAANHSYLHVWYTYRDQLMTVAAGMMAYTELVSLPKSIVNRPKAK